MKALSEKLNKDELVDKLKDITSKSNQREQSLERILELTKRFYVEQKQQQLNAKIQKLGEKQDEVSNVKNEENTSKKQQELNKDFDDIQKEFHGANRID